MSETIPAPSEKVVSDYDRLHHDVGSIRLDRWALLELSGEDAISWLKGQVTNDLRSVQEGSYHGFCFCSNVGRIEAIVDAWFFDDSFWLVCDRSEVKAVKRRVDEMVILEEVQLTDRSDEFQLISVLGPKAPEVLGAKLPSSAGRISIEGFELMAFKSNRIDADGWDLWSLDPNALQHIENLVASIEPGAYEIARIEAGQPYAGIDYDAKTLPPELGPAFTEKYVSYTKGCYTGQEVLMRIHSRGHTNKTWVALTSDSPIPVGARLSHPQRADAGIVTSAARSPHVGFMGVASVRNDFSLEGQQLTVGPDINVAVRALPIRY